MLQIIAAKVFSIGFAVALFAVPAIWLGSELINHIAATFAGVN
jgi:hypothetical protein